MNLNNTCQTKSSTRRYTVSTNKSSNKQKLTIGKFGHVAQQVSRSLNLERNVNILFTRFKVNVTTVPQTQTQIQTLLDDLQLAKTTQPLQQLFHE